VTRHVTIGTAGHVDHGKTALVKALTGVDTDRWEEEKRRGITIDLGFASFGLGDGWSASVVDVPGHEDFVRNMVAGATGIDVALLVVAADEGIMPQTREHLAILEFLGVHAGAVAITKTDLVDSEWIDLVEEELQQRLATSPVHWHTPVRVSVVNGTGVEDVTASLLEVARQAGERSERDLFRLPVDRSFSMPGAGTVVTGTAWSGAVAVGEEVRVLPGNARARVRGIQVHGEPRDRAEPGRRTALALAGLSKDDAPRGSVAVTSPHWEPTRAMDVLLTLLPGSRSVTQRSRIRVHIGTAEVFARVTPTAAEIPPGGTGAARLRLEQPLVARCGDRGIVRSYSPVTTVGGCVVVDPHPLPRPRRPVRLEDRAVADPRARLAAAVEVAGRGGIGVRELPVRLGIPPDDVGPLVEDMIAGGAHEVSGRLYAGKVIDDARRTMIATLEGYHKQHPLEPGMPRELLRASLDDLQLGAAVPDMLVAAGELAYDGGTVRSAAFRVQLDAGQAAAVARIEGIVGKQGGQGSTVGELEAEVTGAQRVAEFLVRDGKLVRIGGDRYYATDSLAHVRDQILHHIRESGRGAPSELRVVTGLTRKYLIPILEWMDARGYTRREGDERKLGPKADRPDD